MPVLSTAVTVKLLLAGTTGRRLSSNIGHWGSINVFGNAYCKGWNGPEDQTRALREGGMLDAGIWSEIKA